MKRGSDDRFDALRMTLANGSVIDFRRPGDFDFGVSNDLVVDDSFRSVGVDDLSFEASFTVTVEDAAVETLREDAGHEFVCDRFDGDTFRDAIHAVEAAGFDDAKWFVPGVVDGVRDWYDARTVDDDRVDFGGVAFKYPIYEFDTVGTDAFLVADRAVTTPPDPIAALDNPVLVREPAGVARIDTSAGFEWGPSE